MQWSIAFIPTFEFRSATPLNSVHKISICGEACESIDFQDNTVVCKRMGHIRCCDCRSVDASESRNNSDSRVTGGAYAKKWVRVWTYDNTGKPFTWKIRVILILSLAATDISRKRRRYGNLDLHLGKVHCHLLLLDEDIPAPGERAHDAFALRVQEHVSSSLLFVGPYSSLSWRNRINPWLVSSPMKGFLPIHTQRWCIG